MSHDEVENLINNIAGDMEAPGVDSIREIAASRKQSRQRVAKVGGFAAIALVLAGLALWANRPQPAELATGGETEAAETASAVADDSAPLEFEESNGHLPGVDDVVITAEIMGEGEPTPLVQRRLIAMPRWFVKNSEGIPDSNHPEGARVSFQDDQISFYNCDGVNYEITWTASGFTAQRRIVQDPSIPVPMPGCGVMDEAGNFVDIEGGIIETPMPFELDVATEVNDDGTITLKSVEWELTLVATGPNDSDIQKTYVSLPVEEAADLAEANGVAWRVVYADGEDLRVRADLNPDRVNFSIQNGIVTHVRNDAELAAQNSPQTTTTTTEPPETTTTTIEPGPCDQSLSFLGEIGDAATRATLPESIFDIRAASEITVLGRITAVEPGPTHAWVPERIEVDPDDPRAQVQVLHFTLDVDRAHPSSASVGQSVQFAFMFSPGTDHEVVEASWVTGCELVVFLFQGAVTNYDPDVWSTVFDGGAIGVVNGSRVEFPNAFEYIEALPIVEVDELFGTS